MKKAKVTKDQLFELIQKVAEEAANATGTGATFTPGAGEQYATPKAFKKKVKESNTSAPFKKGFKHGTHPESKAMDYKQLYEIDDYYQPEEQDDDEDDYDWYTNSYTKGSIEFESGDIVKILPGAGFMRPGGVTGEIHDNNGDGTYSVLIDAPGRPMKNIDGNHLRLQRRGLDEIDVQNSSTDEILTYLQAAKQNGTLSPDAQEVFLQWMNTPGASREEIVRVLRKLTGMYINEGLGNEIGATVYFRGDIGEKYPTSQGYYGVIEDVIPARNYNMMAIYQVIVYDRNGNEIRTVKVDWTNLTSKNSIQEGYTQFRNETKTRSKPEQFHQAVKAVKKRVQEINKLFEYVSKLKTELSEDKEGLKYKPHTEKAIGQIKEMVSSLNQNIRKFK